MHGNALPGRSAVSGAGGVTACGTATGVTGAAGMVGASVETGMAGAAVLGGAREAGEALTTGTMVPVDIEAASCGWIEGEACGVL